MRVLLVCGAGFSTSILMKKMIKYCEEQGEELKIEASSLGGYKSVWQDYDCILLGPQVRYQKDNITANVTIPVDVINSVDYGVGNADKVVAQAHKLIEK